MAWQLKSLVVTFLGVGLLSLAYLVESRTWGSPLTYLFGVPGVLLSLVGILHFSLNTLWMELTKQ